MTDFAAQYLALRRKEGRVFPDEIVRALPQLPKGHSLAAEWALRVHSSQLVLDRLQTGGKPWTSVVAMAISAGACSRPGQKKWSV